MDSSNPTPNTSPPDYPTISRGKELRYEGPEEVRRLFEELGIHYLERTAFAPDCHMFQKTALSDYAEHGKEPKISAAQFELFSQLVREGHRAPIYIKWISDEVGYGVFAREDIPAGTLIAEYSGVVVPKNRVRNRTWSWKYPIKGHFIDTFPREVSLDGGIFGNEMRFLNHGDHRNTSPVFVHDGTTWVNCYYARKPIAQDEELLINYGKRYWKHRTKLDL